MDYEYYYNNAKSRYYNACSEITTCENRINTLNSQKQQKINQINKLQTDIKNNKEALQGVEEIIKSNSDFEQKLGKVTNTTEQATTNYNSMVSCDTVTNKNLTDVYSSEMSSTKQTVNTIFSTLRTKKNNLSNKIVELQNQLSRAKTDLSNIENGIKTTQGSLQDWKQVKTSASYDMEYYRRKMNEAASE